MRTFYQFITALLFSFAASLHAGGEPYTPQLVDTLVDPYFAMHRGLAGDDLAATQAGAKAFVEALNKAPADVGATKSLKEVAGTIAQATDIKSARTEFQTLSNQLIKQVKQSGTTGDAKLHLAYCPMAHGGKGGTWMQADKAIANPYYGKMMLACGAIKGDVTKESGDGFSKEHAH